MFLLMELPVMATPFFIIKNLFIQKLLLSFAYSDKKQN